MSTTYYEYRKALVNIAHRLQDLDGWTVYGYHADQSDAMTDYYDPAYWGGLAEKNGFLLVVNHSEAAQEYRRKYKIYTDDAPAADVAEKIAKLERMTQERGASAAEEATARAAIEKLKEKRAAGFIEREDVTPGHMANPPRCNWHIEKNGVILDKGAGLLKFSDVVDISSKSLDRVRAEWQRFNNSSREKWIEEETKAPDYWGNYATEEQAARRYEEAQERYKLLEAFNALIARFNNVCGGMVGNAGENGYIYEARKITKYKTVYRFRPSESGSIKAGQCFRLKSNFSQGCGAGYVYRFTVYADTLLKAERVSLKSNKERTGRATSSNCFGIYAPSNTGYKEQRFCKWIESGAIEYGEIVEELEPYEVEKMVKVDANGNEYKPNNSKPAKEAQENKAKPENAPQYIIKADTDTRDGSALWVVTLSERVTGEQFAQIREEMKNAGGYYSKFKKGFIFRENPAEKLTGEKPEEAPEEPQEEPQEEPETVQEEPKKAAPGYTGEASQLFTPEEIQQLHNGGQVHKGKDYQRRAYFATEYADGVRFVYSVYSRDGKPTPEKSADFNGFIYNSSFYDDFTKIAEEAAADINAAIIEKIPTEEAAEKNAGTLEGCNADRISAAKEYKREREAMRHYIEGTAPTLTLYYNHESRADVSEIIQYIINPAEFVAERAEEYTKNRGADIYNYFIIYNKTCEALEEIKKDTNAQRMKKIHSLTADGTEKTYNIKLTNGETVKANADSVRRLCFVGYISDWSIQSGDRAKLPKDERGRNKDIKPADIVTITHGTKLIYKAS